MWTRGVLVLLAGGAFCAGLGYGQDSPSVADAARQARLLKKQSDTLAKDTPTKDGQTHKPRVITNDEIPSHVEPAVTSGSPNNRYAQPSFLTQAFAAERWKLQIQGQKNAIASLQQEIANASESIQYAGATSVANPVQWNERQKQKQDQVEGMKALLEQQQKRLEDLQEAARKQGMGGAVYDP